MLYFSSLLNKNPAAGRILAALDEHDMEYSLIESARDIWVRDFMPVGTKDGRFVSFRYEPSYHDENEVKTRTVYLKHVDAEVPLPGVTDSGINLDGGNVVFSPSKATAIICERVFSENADYAGGRSKLVDELERLLAAEVMILPSLSSRFDMTGHADGMVRFVGENTVVVNRPLTEFGFENRVKKFLSRRGFDVMDFPFFSSGRESAVGSYINFLETEKCLFLPVFGVNMDEEAVSTAESIFSKTVVPVNVREIAEYGGALNCISWEDSKI